MSPKFKKIFFLVFLFVVFLYLIPIVRADNATTTVTVLVVCGDGFIDPTEVCDPGNPPIYPPDLGGLDCGDFNDPFGNPYTTGELHCAADCMSYETNFCSICGNALREGFEQCDSSDYGGDTCQSPYGYTDGAIDCTDSCFVNLVGCYTVLPPPTGGGSGGGGSSGGGSSGGGASGQATGFKPGSNIEPNETKVVISGKAYPSADVHILIDGKVIGIVRADAKADFYFESTDIPPGVGTFGLWSEDSSGLKSTLLTLTFRVLTGTVTTISGAYISPSIETDKDAVERGQPILVYGQTVPDTEVHVYFHSNEEIIEFASSTDKGAWELNFNTDVLEEDYHTVKAQFALKEQANVITSNFSKVISFYVGKPSPGGYCPGADLNKDNRVNLIDFSILLYYWDSDDACADQNHNGKVDLVDFSIMLYNWTG